jgi:hypothetical protein
MSRQKYYMKDEVKAILEGDFVCHARVNLMKVISKKFKCY